MGSEYVHAVLNLMVVILLMFSLFLVSKKYKLTKKKSNKQINIINSASIGTKEKILLIKVNGVMLLLGATPNHIETLYVFNEMEDIVYSIELSIVIADIESKLIIIVAERMVNDFFPHNEQDTRHVESNFWRSAIETQVVDSYISVNVTLPDTTIKVSDLMKLKSGDLLPIGDPTLVYVCLNNLKLFRASAAQANSKRVIKIISEV